MSIYSLKAKDSYYGDVRNGRFILNKHNVVVTFTKNRKIVREEFARNNVQTALRFITEYGLVFVGPSYIFRQEHFYMKDVSDYNNKVEVTKDISKAMRMYYGIAHSYNMRYKNLRDGKTFMSVILDGVIYDQFRLLSEEEIEIRRGFRSSVALAA